MITTVVFDLDDTLYSEIEYCRSGFGAVAAFIADMDGRPEREAIFGQLWSQFTAGNHTKTFNTAFDSLGIDYDDSFIASAVKVYRNHSPKITLPTESKELLDSLRDKYVLGLLTDGFLPAQELKVKALGIEGYFKYIVYTEQLGREFWKPSPVGFEKLMTELKQRAEEMVYVADNEKKDFIAPNQLGFVTVKVNRPTGIHNERAADAVGVAGHVINNLSELQQLLEKL